MAVPVHRKLQQKSNADKKAAAPAIWQSNKWIALTGIVILTALVFSNSLSKTFTSIDDDAYIKDNPLIKSLSWESIKNIFTTFHAANYHPLTILSYAFEFRLFGLNAVPYHFVNLVIHLVNVCLVFVLFEKLNQRKEVAAIVALLFGIHPMHVESVAWISERKDLLYSLFYLSGLITYVHYIGENKRKKLIIIFILFLLSLLSKPAAVTFPLLLVLFDYYFARGWNKKVVMEKIPFFLLAMAFGIINIVSQKSAGALNDIVMPHYSVFERIFVVCYGLVFYPVKLFLPFNLSAMHYAPEKLPYYFYFCPVVIASIVYFVAKARRMKHELIFGLLFYLFSIILVLQIIPVGYAIVAERYSYIPYFGLFFIAGNFYADVRDRKISFLSFLKPYLNYIVACVIILFAIQSYQRNKVWRTALSLSTDVAQKYPESFHAQYALGLDQKDAGDFSGALISFSRSIELNSSFPDPYYFRGNIYFQQKNYDQSLKDCLKALELINNSEQKEHYADALYAISMIYSTTDRHEEAIEYFNRCLAIQPNENLYQNRAVSYFYLKKYSAAIGDYDKALELNPRLATAYFSRAQCHYRLEQINEACDDWKKAASLGYEEANKEIDARCK